MATMSINKARSHYKTNPEVLTTFNASYLIPLKVLKVVPNGVYKLTAGTIARLPALKVPVMGKLNLEFFAVYVPFDLLDKNWEKLITEGHDNSFDEDVYGQGSHTPNTQSNNASIVPDLYTPKLKLAGEFGFEVKSGDLLNRLGMPIANADAHKRSVEKNKKLLAELQEKYKDVGGGANKIAEEYRLKKVREVPAYIPNNKFNAYPVRGYNLIWNSIFRSKFLQDPKQIDYGSRESDPTDYELLRVNRSADWFSRGFVNSQLNPVDVPLSSTAEIPVIADTKYANVGVIEDLVPNPDFIRKYDYFADSKSFPTIETSDKLDIYRSSGKGFNYSHFRATSGTDPIHFAHEGIKTDDPLSMKLSTYYANVADISSINPRVQIGQAITMNLNDLRYAIGLSHISQKALYGTDMETILKMNFNLVLPKAQLKEPYLFGYKKVPVEINQVTQTAPSSDGSSYIGDVYGQSTTINRMDDGSFVFRSYNFGYIYLLCCVRHESVYQYGIDPIFTENDKFDYFQPDLQGLSNIGIPKLYIYFSGNSESDYSTFNFNEPFSELKHDHNVVNGEFSSDSNTPLDFYHLADIYNDAPSYDGEWIQSTTKEVLDRALTITSDNSDQVHAYFKFTYERTLPMSDYFIGYDYI